jgi:hypothetical protein
LKAPIIIEALLLLQLCAGFRNSIEDPFGIFSGKFGFQIPEYVKPDRNVSLTDVVHGIQG